MTHCEEALGETLTGRNLLKGSGRVSHLQQHPPKSTNTTDTAEIGALGES